MSEIIKVKVTKVSAQPTTNGNYIHTVKTEGKKVSVLGQEKMSGQLTYFIALPGQTPVGSEHEIDLSKFNITERPMEVTDEATGETRSLPLKWLHIK